MEEFLELLKTSIDIIFDTFWDKMAGDAEFLSGTGIWNFMIKSICGIIATTPEDFSSAAWNYTVNVVMDTFLSLAASILNLMYLIGIIRQAVKLKENYTAEILVDSLIKVIIANYGLLNGLQLMRIVFKISATLGSALLGNGGELFFKQEDHDFGSFLFYLVFGIVYFIVSLVCSCMIFLAVYGRYMTLYFLVGIAPLAWVTLPGGPGVNSTFFAWLRMFLAKALEAVAIAFLIGIGSAMCNKIDFGSIGGLTDGAVQALQNMATMVLLAGSVKGIDVIMKKLAGA